MVIRECPDRTSLSHQLHELGVVPGSILLVHTAFSMVSPVEGGPIGVIDALLRTLGSEGTLVMPSMTDDDEQPFDAAKSSCVGMGVVADTFWRMEGVMRSESPHAFAAVGPCALSITAPHPLEVPHGPDSPVGRVHDLDGQVLLLGVGHDANTTIHLAENLSGVRYRRPCHSTVLVGGQPRRLDYDELDHCCQNFSLLDAWLEPGLRQRRGTIGRAEARLARSCDIVAAAVARLRKDETVFLHPAGACRECDEARESIRT